jgi:inner membrane transporter RhtA
VLVLLVQDGRLRGLPLLYAVAAGVLSSVVPYAADLTALRHVPPRFFGVFMSTHPVLAALVGLVLLGQVLALHEWAGIAVVVAANALAVATAGPSRRHSVADDHARADRNVRALAEAGRASTS